MPIINENENVPVHACWEDEVFARVPTEVMLVLSKCLYLFEHGETDRWNRLYGCPTATSPRRCDSNQGVCPLHCSGGTAMIIAVRYVPRAVSCILGCVILTASAKQARVDANLTVREPTSARTECGRHRLPSPAVEIHAIRDFSKHWTRLC